MVILENIDIDMDFLENIDIDMDFLESIDNDIDKGILQNINIDKILYWLEFGISNRAKCVMAKIFKSVTINNMWETFPLSLGAKIG